METPSRITDLATIDLEVRRVEGGGFGVVYIGPDHKANGAWRALKMHRDRGGQRVTDMFVREALTWVGLWPHPNLLPALGVKLIHDRAYIVLPYAMGGNLRAHLGHRHGLPRRLEWAQMIASGLLALHTPEPELFRPWPIVHRDLKPENILLDGKREAKISDFGLARAFEFSEEGAQSVDDDALSLDEEPLPHDDGLRSRRLRTEGGIAIGTPAYMAPEQWVGGEVGAPIDLYAFGVILSELFFGRHPLVKAGAPHLEWRALHTIQAPQRMREQDSEIPATIESLYLACLEKRPQNRPTAAEALATLRGAAEACGEAPYVAPELRPRTPGNMGWSFYHWAWAYKKFTLLAQALERIKRALELLPEQPDLLLLHASLVGRLGQYDEALAILDRVLAKPPSEVLRLLCVKERSSILELANRHEEADAASRSYLAYRLENGDAWFHGAFLHARWARHEWLAGRMQETREHLILAEEYALRAVKIDPDFRMYVGFLYAVRKELEVWGVGDPWTYLSFTPSKLRDETMRFPAGVINKQPVLPEADSGS